MRKYFVLIVCSAAAFAVLSGILFVSNKAYSVSSRFEGKIIKRIEYVGIKKISGKEEIVPLQNIDGEGLVAKEHRQRFIDQKGLEVKPKELVAEGDPLNSEAIKETIRVFFNTGRVSDMRVEAQDLGDGVLLRFLCEERPNVSKIEFRGLNRVLETDLTEKLFLKEGEPFRRDLLEKSLPEIKKKYNETGLSNSIIDYYTYPDPDRTDGAIIVSIRVDEGEEVKVAKVSILGASQIPDYEITSVMETKPKALVGDGSYKRDILEQDKARIVAYYKKNGYLDAEILNEKEMIDYEWEDPDQTESHIRQMYITIKIKEGEQYYFDGYEFHGISGNVGIKEDDDLITESRVKNLVALKTASDDTRTRFIRKVTLVPNPDDAVLDYLMMEKDRYDISMLYAHFGYLNARIAPTPVDHYEDRVENGVTKKVKFRKYKMDIVEGNRAFVEKIYIRGLKKTKEKVVRREVLMKEETNGVAEPFDSYKMNATREKLFNLGLFKEVNIDIRPGSTEDKVNLVVDVQEQPTGTVSVGGSWASQSGFSIFCDLGEKNFMGNGWIINLRMVYGPTQISSTLSFTEPWLFDIPLAWKSSVSIARATKTDTASIFSTSDDGKYVKQSAGYSTGLSYRFLYYFSAGVGWGHSLSKITEATGSCSDDIFVEKKHGFQEKRAVSIDLGYDSRDSYLNPTRGLNAAADSAMIGGFLLRGDYHYLSHTISGEYYYTPFHLPLLPEYPLVFQIRGSGNFLTPPFMRKKVEKFQSQDDNPWLKASEYLNLGGPGYSGSGLLRGWDTGDDALPKSWRDGLFHQILYGAEVRVPIHPQYVWALMFFDAGSLWNDSYWEKGLISDTKQENVTADKASGQLRDIRDIAHVNVMSYFKYSYGFGFKVQIPMMPLRFYFGRKMLWDQGSGFRPISGFNFQFTMGDILF